MRSRTQPLRERVAAAAAAPNQAFPLAALKDLAQQPLLGRVVAKRQNAFGRAARAQGTAVKRVEHGRLDRSEQIVSHDSCCPSLG
jgi:uncharacterized protein (DUF2249 family)